VQMREKKKVVTQLKDELKELQMSTAVDTRFMQKVGAKCGGSKLTWTWEFGLGFSCSYAGLSNRGRLPYLGCTPTNRQTSEQDRSRKYCQLLVQTMLHKNVSNGLTVCLNKH
jgi:hypothetical protein